MSATTLATPPTPPTTTRTFNALDLAKEYAVLILLALRRPSSRSRTWSTS
jgi:hypothetical protein